MRGSRPPAWLAQLTAELSVRGSFSGTCPGRAGAVQQASSVESCRGLCGGVLYRGARRTDVSPVCALVA
eukprot:312727-Pyramimonas_sp.AAC.1